MRKQNYCTPNLEFLQIDANDLLTSSPTAGTDKDKIDHRSDDVANDVFD